MYKFECSFVSLPNQVDLCSHMPAPDKDGRYELYLKFYCNEQSHICRMDINVQQGVPRVLHFHSCPCRFELFEKDYYIVHEKH